MLPIKRNTLLTGLAVSVAYGLIAYFLFLQNKDLASVAFLGLVPLAIGALPLLISDVDQIKSYVYVFFLPWVSIFGTFALLFALLKEGALCILLLGLPFYALAMVGTLIAVIIRAFVIRSNKRKLAAAALMLLPFLVVGLEQRYLVREHEVTLRSVRIVAAPATEVFDRLAEFETIRDDEYEPGFFHYLGVPRPIRATVDRKALGGHRIGYFEGGLEFRELITAYDSPRRMTFDIAVDPSVLPEGSTERHALELGYFRFVDATYTLEPVGDGRVRLELSSRYVARSSVNAYGELWANAIITDFQDRVIDILARRCEDRARVKPSEVAGNAP